MVGSGDGLADTSGAGDSGPAAAGAGDRNGDAAGVANNKVPDGAAVVIEFGLGTPGDAHPATATAQQAIQTRRDVLIMPMSTPPSHRLRIG